MRGPQLISSRALDFLVHRSLIRPGSGFETIGDDRMNGPLGVVVSPFRPTTRMRSEDLTTTLKRRDVGAVNSRQNGLEAYKGVNFSRFCADVFYGWPLGLDGTVLHDKLLICAQFTLA